MPKKPKHSIPTSSLKPASSPKEEKLFRNLLRMTTQYMNGRGYHPLSIDQLMQRLNIPPQHLLLFQEVLETIIKEGKVEMIDHHYTWKQKSDNRVTGTLSVHVRGFAFLRPDPALNYPEDVFIPKQFTSNAVDGDVVEVVVNTDSISEKGPEGKVIAILSRGRTHVAGTVTTIGHSGEIEVYAPLLGGDHFAILQAPANFELAIGDRVVMEVIEWGHKEDKTVCRFSHCIGSISDPSCDITAAIEEFNLRHHFTSQVLDEASDLGNKVANKDLGSREDLRATECFTIDPDTAKDYDDALSLTKDQAGNYFLGVHIADVSHYVRPGTALDTEARLRCNSTYFPGVCIPMLPSALSNNLCSLKADVNRLTASVLMEFDADGNLTSYRMTRSVIKSAKRLTYREAKAILEEKKKSKHLPTLNLMVELCGLLKKKRYERGSIEFAIPELVVLVDEQGVPEKMDYIAYDITHQLVEEFMLKANEIVALEITKRGKPLAFRVHGEPAEENLKDFALLAAAFGFNLKDKPTSYELQKMFEEAADSPYGQYLASSYIRRMRMAVYSSENIGHYGLGLSHYCHFTSPIRRYIDLVVHRILFGESEDLQALEKIALQCSEQERISAKAEQSVVLLKKLRLLARFYQQDANRGYQAVVTRVKPFGITFEVMEIMLEGFLHVSELYDDYFEYYEKSGSLIGNHTGYTYCSGDKITVQLVAVDLITKESKWRLCADQEPITTKKLGSKKADSRKADSRKVAIKEEFKKKSKSLKKLAETSDKKKTSLKSSKQSKKWK